MTPPLLFLCHRIPFPPNKGDKIRSFHLLKHLAQRYRIFLGAFIDDPEDWSFTQALDAWCEQTFFLKLDPQRARLRSLRGLIDGRALTLPYYQNPAMGRWVDEIIAREDIEQLLVYSSAMAQYLMAPEYEKLNRVIDFVDVDSDKWRQYSEKKHWPQSWVYRREARKLLSFEGQTAARFDASFFVSSEEAKLFRQLAPGSAEKVFFYSNGVDVEVFSPDADYPNPYPRKDEAVIVFTGAMDYWPNADAVSWFVEEVFPQLKQHWPTLQFYIVGSRPSERVTALGRTDGVTVTGSVPDVKPYIHHAKAVVAPMRIARGIQNKVLEAMAMAKPVVVTSMGLEGIDARDGEEVMVADDAATFVDRLSGVFSSQTNDLGRQARQKVCNTFTWETTLPKVDQWLK